MYPVKPDRIDDGLERVVEEMRRARVAEEAKRGEAERLNEMMRKKMNEMRGKAKKGRASVTEDDIQSYDLNGKNVEVRHMKKLPTLVPMCTRMYGSGSYEPSPKQSSIGRKDPSLKRNKPGATKSMSELLGKLLPQRRVTEKTSGLAPQKVQMYEALVPAVGVTFAEQGKNLKYNSLSMSQYTGKLSKSDFKSLFNDHMLRSTGFFPNLAKTQGFVTGPPSARMVLR